MDFIHVKDNPNLRPSKVTFKIAVVDNIDLVPSAAQMELKKAMIEGTGIMKYILICHKPGNLIGFIRSQAAYFKTAPIAEADALTVVLTALSKMRVGYDRDGIQELFRLFPDLRMSNIFDSLQRTFWKYHYISVENLRKSGDGATEKPEIDSSSALQPFQRCSICTLFPPCKHFSVEKMAELGKSHPLLNLFLGYFLKRNLQQVRNEEESSRIITEEWSALSIRVLASVAYSTRVVTAVFHTQGECIS